ncbi:MAG: hypothetical protein ABS42_00085 [Bdellovibrio sp. SCN 50-8]|nr:MAG: hypothetical protein ABS42_00085 [Bdellovibrio sp. SCN 50-8]
MHSFVHIEDRKIFSLAEAQRILPIIQKITEKAQKETQVLVQQLELIQQVDAQRSKVLEIRIDEIMNQWRGQISRLGGIPQGVWVVDFDHGNGLYCWKYPEMNIYCEHGYQDGFTGRRYLKTPTA